jgi:hypothetical protein
VASACFFMPCLFTGLALLSFVVVMLTCFVVPSSTNPRYRFSNSVFAFWALSCVLQRHNMGSVLLSTVELGYNVMKGAEYFVSL